eukprot:5983129-Pleurochrysis_carterae.AAC.2
MSTSLPAASTSRLPAQTQKCARRGHRACHRSNPPRLSHTAIRQLTTCTSSPWQQIQCAPRFAPRPLSVPVSNAHPVAHLSDRYSPSSPAPQNNECKRTYLLCEKQH